MRDFVESPAYRHIAIVNLAVHAQRLGKLFACAGTWYKLIKQRGWQRPRRRVHPDKPRVGLVADRPNQFWHADATVIRLTSGARIYLQAIIDNFSRKILSWRVTDALTSETTRELLIEAIHGLHGLASSEVSLVIDGGGDITVEGNFIFVADNLTITRNCRFIGFGEMKQRNGAAGDFLQVLSTAVTLVKFRDVILNGNQPNTDPDNSTFGWVIA